MQKILVKAASFKRWHFSALLAGLVLSGCVVGPDYKKTTFLMPSSWSKNSSESAPTAPAQLSNWWQNLKDPMLNDLVASAISGNNDVATAKAKVREARATLFQTTGTLYPGLDGSAQGARSKSQGGHEGSQYRGGFDSSWEVDLFGANKRAVEAAQYGLDSAKEDMRATMVTLIGDVATNYVEARGLQQQIILAKRTALSQRGTAKLTRDKFVAGGVSQLDVSNAEGQAATTEASIPQLEANLAITIHRLSVLTGQTPTTLNNAMEKAKRIPQPKLPIPTGIPADVLLTRPDIRVAERQYAASTARIGQKEADLYPSVTLTGDITTNATQVGSLGKASSISWSFGPGVSLPIFHGGQRVAGVEIARAQRDQYFIAYRAAVLSALEDVENALVSLSKERQRSAKLAQAAGSYSKALELSQALFRDGNTSFLELLTAERSQYSSQNALIQSRVSIATDYISLMKSLGGGWDGDVDTKRPEIVDGYTGPHIKTAKAKTVGQAESNKQ